MPRVITPGRKWLATELDKDVAEQFTGLCRAEERSVSAGLRLLVKRHVAITSQGPSVTSSPDDEPAAGTATLATG